MRARTQHSKPNEFDIPEEVGSDHFNAWDPEVIKKIDELIEMAGTNGKGPDNRDLVRQMIVTALKSQQAHLDRGDLKLLNRAGRELRYGFRIFQPYREKRKVTIFGSARTSVKSKEYKQAREFSRKIVKKGFMTITGAGPGIMKAGNEGAGRGNSFGVNIRLPFEQTANKFIDKDTLFIDCRFFFTRKVMFLKETSSVALFPGGFGTYDEAMESLTLVQTGKCDPIPIVFIDSPGGRYWSDWKKYMEKHLLKTGKISKEDMSLFLVTNSVAKAVKEITGFYKNYHSMRYLRNNLVMRLEKKIPPKILSEINKKFKDISNGKEFISRGAFPDEERRRDLPRLVFPFNRYNFGRLRQLIDFINSF